MQQDRLTMLLGIQGFRVTAVEQIAVMPAHSVVRVHLERIGDGYYVCGECGQVAPGYDHQWQEVQHLTLWRHLTFLRFKHYRVDCPSCGVRTEALDFVGIRGPRVSRHLAQLVSELCKVMTNKAVGILQALHKHTVKDIDKQAMGKVQAERPLDGLTVLGADEIAVGRGQKYWTMISALEGPRGPELLNVVVGRKERSLKKFLEMVRCRARQAHYPRGDGHVGAFP